MSMTSKRLVDVDALRARGRKELAEMQIGEHAAGFGAPEDDPTGIELLRTAASALASYLATDAPRVPDKEHHCGAHALVMLEDGLERLLTASGYRLRHGRTQGHG
jgi:hypothetical protein